MIDKFLYTFFGYIDSWFEWVESQFTKPKKKKSCKNCGHDCHCGGHCMKDYDGTGAILCCSYCRHSMKGV